ncbi:MAG TPA: hypothetical protein VGQ00_01615 [Candidatus Norongarragalinales archaeon]|jgi:hypothetical protein|nr:hypothetical protein [Candidatus Norongarragalinales archaeon]
MSKLDRFFREAHPVLLEKHLEAIAQNPRLSREKIAGLFVKALQNKSASLREHYLNRLLEFGPDVLAKHVDGIAKLLDSGVEEERV